MILTAFFVFLYTASLAVMMHGFAHALPESPEEEHLDRHLRLAKSSRHV